MTPKEIGRRASELFRLACPANWAKRSEEDQEDVGIDFELEVLEGDKPTGVLFKAQVKGTAHLELSEGEPVLYRVPAEKLTYQLGFSLPVVYALVDVTTGNVYWTPTQGNPDIVRALDTSARENSKTLSIHFNRARMLPRDSDALLEAVSHCYETIAVRSARALSTTSLVAALKHETDLESVAADFFHHAEVVTLERVERLIKERKFTGAMAEAEKLIVSAASSAQARASATEQYLRANDLDTGPKGDHSVRRHRARRAAAALLNGLRSDPNATTTWLHYSRILLRILRVEGAVAADWGLFLSAKVHAVHGTPPNRTVTAAMRSAAVARLNAANGRLQTAILLAARRGQLSPISMLFPRLCNVLAPCLVRLRSEGMTAAASSLMDWLDILRRLSIDVSVRASLWHHVAHCIHAYAAVALVQSGDRIEAERARALQDVGRIGDASVRAEIEEEIAELAKAFAARPPGEPTLADEEGVIRDIGRS